MVFTCNCKKWFTIQSRCKSQKINIKCSQYCYNFWRDCENTRLIQQSKKVLIQLRVIDMNGQEDNDDNWKESECKISSRAQLEKPKKEHSH